jgi:hypothetical protein
MWMTSPEVERPAVQRIAATGDRTGVPTLGSGPQADPDYILLLQILDQHPAAKRQVVETLCGEK